MIVSTLFMHCMCQNNLLNTIFSSKRYYLIEFNCLNIEYLKKKTLSKCIFVTRYFGGGSRHILLLREYSVDNVLGIVSFLENVLSESVSDVCSFDDMFSSRHYNHRCCSAEVYRTTRLPGGRVATSPLVTWCWRPVSPSSLWPCSEAPQPPAGFRATTWRSQTPRNRRWRSIPRRCWTRPGSTASLWS